MIFAAFGDYAFRAPAAQRASGSSSPATAQHLVETRVHVGANGRVINFTASTLRASDRIDIIRKASPVLTLEALREMMMPPAEATTLACSTLTRRG